MTDAKISMVWCMLRISVWGLYRLTGWPGVSLTSSSSVDASGDASPFFVKERVSTAEPTRSEAPPQSDRTALASLSPNESFDSKNDRPSLASE